ncbi:MAG: hypothetical protein KBT07_09045 [Clostridiales bacterium]|nr:hypothetical protein [Candidatus Scatonaster coprocaballi]
MKHKSEQVREIGVARQTSVSSGKDPSIGDILRKARKQLVTKHILIAIAVILLVTFGVFCVVNGYFDRLIDYLIGLAE